MKYYVGIDLGGTNIVAGVVDEEYKIIAKAKTKTENGREAKEIVQSMIDTALKAVEEAGITMEQVESVGIGSPGMVDTEKREVVYAGNLKFLNTPIGQWVEDGLHVPVYLANDADAAAYGEFKAGAGKGCKSMVAVTLGTGVGSGIIINNKIYSGFGFAGGEFGHSVLVANGRPCNCGRKGCIEAYCSATGLINITKDHMNQNKESKMWEMTGGNINKVDGRTAFDAMRLGDAEGKAVVDEYTDYLGEAVVNLTNTLQPQMICIGGGISKEGENLLAPIRAKMEKYAFERFANKKTGIRIAELGNDAGVIGAALIGLQMED